MSMPTMNRWAPANSGQARERAWSDRDTERPRGREKWREKGKERETERDEEKVRKGRDV